MEEVQSIENQQLQKVNEAQIDEAKVDEEILKLEEEINSNQNEESFLQDHSSDTSIFEEIQQEDLQDLDQKEEKEIDENAIDDEIEKNKWRFINWEQRLDIIDRKRDYVKDYGPGQIMDNWNLGQKLFEEWHGRESGKIKETIQYKELESKEEQHTQQDQKETEHHLEQIKQDQNDIDQVLEDQIQEEQHTQQDKLETEQHLEQNEQNQNDIDQVLEDQIQEEQHTQQDQIETYQHLEQNKQNQNDINQVLEDQIQAVNILKYKVEEISVLLNFIKDQKQFYQDKQNKLEEQIIQQQKNPINNYHNFEDRLKQIENSINKETYILEFQDQFDQDLLKFNTKISQFSQKVNLELDAIKTNFNKSIQSVVQQNQSYQEEIKVNKKVIQRKVNQYRRIQKGMIQNIKRANQLFQSISNIPKLIEVVKQPKQKQQNYFISHYKVGENMNKVIEVKDKKIRFERLEFDNQSWENAYAVSGELPNNRISTIKVKYLYQSENDNWQGVMCFLIGSKVKISSIGQLETDGDEDDKKNVIFYGVGGATNKQCNLKVKKINEVPLKSNEDITIIFDPVEANKIEFNSSQFEYYQDCLITGESYRLAIGLYQYPQFVRVELL